MKRITKTVYHIAMSFGSVNFYVLDTGRGLAVIDTGISEQSITTLAQQLPLAGFSLADVRYVLLTHSHYDHIGGLAALQAQTDVTTYAHTADAPFIRGSTTLHIADPGTLPNPIDRFMQQRFIAAGQTENKSPAQVDIELTEGDPLDKIMPGLHVVHLPGHSDGHVGYWLPDQGVLFGGDVAMHWVTRLSMPLRFVSPDWEAVKASIRKAAALQPQIVCLGHGPVITQNAAKKFAGLIARL